LPSPLISHAGMTTLFYIPNKDADQDLLFVCRYSGRRGRYSAGINSFKIDKEMQITHLQTFPFAQCYYTTCIVQLDENNLISSSRGSYDFACFFDSDYVIVIWSKSSSSSYKPIQGITSEKAETKIGVDQLIVLNKEGEEEEFASISYSSLIIWTRKRNTSELFGIKQK